MLTQRIRTLRDGIPSEFLPQNSDVEIKDTVHRHAVVHASKMLARMKKEAVSDGYKYRDSRAALLRFMGAYEVSLEELNFSKIRLTHLTQQADLAWEKKCDEAARKRALKRQHNQL
jgi:hypothetical protein